MKGGAELAVNSPLGPQIEYISFVVHTETETVPAGDYSCLRTEGVPHINEALTTVAFQTQDQGGTSCTITIDNEAVNGGIITGSFEGVLQNSKGETAVVSGVFVFQDE